MLGTSSPLPRRVTLVLAGLFGDGRFVVEDGPDAGFRLEAVDVGGDLLLDLVLLQLLFDFFLSRYEIGPRGILALEHADDVEAAVVFQNRTELVRGEREDRVVDRLRGETAAHDPIVLATIAGAGRFGMLLSHGGEGSAAQDLVSHA